MYLDTAIIVKLLIREPESDWFNNALLGHHFETSELALAEVRSALLAKERGRAISQVERVRAGQKFLDMVEDEIIRVLPLNGQTVERAIAIQQACHPRVPLRTLDALHIASCDLHRSNTLATTDGRMREAGQQLAIALFPASLDDVVVIR